MLIQTEPDLRNKAFLKQLLLFLGDDQLWKPWPIFFDDPTKTAENHDFHCANSTQLMGQSSLTFSPNPSDHSEANILLPSCDSASEVHCPVDDETVKAAPTTPTPTPNVSAVARNFAMATEVDQQHSGRKFGFFGDLIMIYIIL